jgi:predicted MPP superfamily phosphohydrolase
LWVYVSAGTGTWGPPVRLGTRPELTLLRLVAASGPRRR